MKSAITFILYNFPLVMLIISILIAFSKSGNFFNRLCWAVFIFPVGLGGFWGFIYHAFYAEIASNYIGWQPSPFEFEVALANLAMSIMGIISAFASTGYKKATATFASIFLLGAAIGHIHQIFTLHNTHPGNAGTILSTDIILPIALWLAIIFSKEKQQNQISWTDH